VCRNDMTAFLPHFGIVVTRIRRGIPSSLHGRSPKV
jgi:hypothetical protein